MSTVSWSHVHATLAILRLIFFIFTRFLLLDAAPPRRPNGSCCEIHWGLAESSLSHCGIVGTEFASTGIHEAAAPRNSVLVHDTGRSLHSEGAVDRDVEHHPAGGARSRRLLGIGIKLGLAAGQGQSGCLCLFPGFLHLKATLFSERCRQIPRPLSRL